MKARKYRVGDQVRIETMGGAEGFVQRRESAKTYTVMPFDFSGNSVVSVDDLVLIDRPWMKTPPLERSGYVWGVRYAEERRKAKEERLKATVDAFSDWGASALAESLEAAKAHRDANRAKYATQAKMTVKFTPVAKGSVPMRVNAYMISRRSYRSLLARANRSGRTVHDEVVDFNVFAAEIGLPPILNRGGI